MSVRSNCPSCGAPVQFRWSSAVQAKCEYCQAILVRHDVDLQKVGEVADLPVDASPLQIMTEGQYRGKNFMVVGRIVYQWEQGRWNEWHIVFSDGSSGWLSDAQAEYAVSFWVQLPHAMPPADQLPRGQAFNWNNANYTVTVLTPARYVGFDGELPFTTQDRTEMLFADLRTEDGRFATLDYSEDPPLLFMGETVDFASLQLRNLRQFEGW